MTVVEDHGPQGPVMVPTKSMDHHELIEDMKTTSKLTVEERVRLAKANRKTQLQGYNEWAHSPDSADGPQTVRITFPHDVYLMDAASKGEVQDMRALLKQGEGDLCLVI